MANQRLLPIKNGYNFRDLGGYPTADGHQIKWHRLIRTGSLARLDQTDLTVLDNIPISLDIDLRAPDEVKKDPDRVPSQAKYYHLPVFEADETDASHSDEEIAAQMQQPGNGYHHMIDVYHRMTTAASAKQAYQKLFNLLLNNELFYPYKFLQNNFYVNNIFSTHIILFIKTKCKEKLNKYDYLSNKSKFFP